MRFMKDQIKYDIGDKVNVEVWNCGTKQVMEGIISMITVTKGKIKYRAKFGYDKQSDFLQDEVIE